MRVLALTIVLLLIVTIIPQTIKNDDTVAIDADPILAQVGTITRNWTIQFVLINYDSTVIDTDALIDGFPTQRQHTSEVATITYNINYKIEFASEEYESDVRQVILTNSVNGTDTGTRLDEAALKYHKENINDPQRIFYPRDGRSINATVLENWFAENPYVEPPGLGYMFYLLNFSEFDSPDHAIEHWYDYSPVDPDTGEKQNWFRLEWDNSLNPDVKYEYPGFGGLHNIYVLDPSADQWYLKWARIWWDTQVDYEHMSIDLDEKVKGLDLSTQTGIDGLTEYLFNYMYDPVTRLMMPRSPMSAQNDVTRFVDSGYLKVLVIAMDVADGISVDSLRWVTNAEVQRNHLEELFPFIEWEVNVEYIDIDQDQAWKDLFWDYASIVDGKTIVDGAGMFGAIRDKMRWKYVDIYDENINVFGVVFIKKNMEMHVYGKQYTGLGGGGQTVIWKSWERYYRSDGVTPKAGISSIQLHETMHAIGLGHTWALDHYVSDFSRNVMGYYGRFNGTGRFEQNWVQSTYLDQLEAQVVADFEEKRPTMGTVPNDRSRIAEEKAAAFILQAREYYNRMDWKASFNALQSAKGWITTMMWALRDSTPPEILRWGIEGTPLQSNTTVWATVADDSSGIVNVSVHVQIGEEEQIFLSDYSSGNWTAEIPQISTDITVRIWVSAQDRGMNVGQSDVLTYGEDWDTTGSLLTMAIIASASLLVVAVVIVIIKRQRRV